MASLEDLTMLQDESLFNNAAAGGIFDGLCCGHCKLLTLAASSAEPMNSKHMLKLDDGMPYP